jgi:glutamate-1-semialdehyde 2,1-aminomutase
MKNYEKSEKLYNRAVKKIPGGVNSPVRAFKSVERIPVFIKKGSGSKIWDEDDNEYIDYLGSWGPLILGHNHPEVLDAVKKTVMDGSSFGLPTRREVELAELISECIPSIEKVRLTTSGTEACMSAIRLARAFTNRNKIIKFAGCYHGHSDSLLVKAGSGALTYNMMDSNGITETTVKDTITAEFNDIGGIERIFAANKNQIAALIVEPVAANMGLVLPVKNFLEKLRTLTKENGSLLIFDEVISGFRIGLAGAQGHYGIKPDLTVLGKIIGGGYPIGAFGGKKDIMDLIAPQGKVYHAGTLSGNPVSVAAGLATLNFLKKNQGIYKELETKTKNIIENAQNTSAEKKLKINSVYLGSLFTIFFTDKKIINLSDTKSADVGIFKKYFSFMLENGIIVPPSQFEAHFVSLAHSKEDIEKTVRMMNNFFESL